MRRVLAGLAVLLVLTGCTTGSEPSAGPAEAASRAKGRHVEIHEPGPEGARRTEVWRTEVWRDVQLEVPAAWALGYAPLPDGDGALSCGVGPLELSGQQGRPYVGRPGYGSDLCLREELDDVGLDRPGVWFGSPLPVGDAIARTGLHQVTVEAGTGRVTVATEDEAVLEHVLGSIEQVGEDANGCPVSPRPEGGYPDEGYGEVRSFAVCVYDWRAGWVRSWTASLSTGRAARVVQALDEASGEARPGKGCRARDGQLVLLRMTTDDPFGDDPLRRDLVVRPSGCAALQQPATEGRSWVRLTPDLVRPWSVAGVRTYVYSSGLPRSLDRFFRPIWG